jgi:hypothetical protein
MAVPESTDMQIWTELQSWLVAALEARRPIGRSEQGQLLLGEIEAVKPDEVVLLASLPQGTLQRIGVRLVSVDDEEKWVEVRTPICHDHELDPREALFRNCQLAVGHLELRPDNRKYWYRHMLSLRDLRPPWAQFAYVLALIATVGDWIEHDITGVDRW